MRIGLLYFTKNGELIAKKLTVLCEFEFTVFNKQIQTAKKFVKEHFDLDALIFIGATGIAVRLIGNNIKSKDVDPAVIVIDEQAQFIIPILSGHIGGANELADKLAKELGGTPVITTATDLNDVFAVDIWSKKSNCVIGNVQHIKYISSALLRGDEVGFSSDFACSNELPKGIYDNTDATVGIMVSTSETKQPFNTTLNVIPKIITVGVGCKKNTNCKEFEDYLLTTLKEQNISFKSIKRITSIDLKKEETCIKLFCEKFKLRFCTYSASELLSVEGEFTSSEFVKKTTGVDNICERSAMYKNDGELLLKKQSNHGITISIAKEKWRCKF
ncbi:MAG: cobalt-precorrin 5A hydrolase [Oscillospiraceae bacterium]